MMLLRTYVECADFTVWAAYGNAAYGNAVCFTTVGKGDDETAYSPFHDLPLHGNNEVSNTSYTV